MCLFSIKKEDDEEYEVSRRVYQRDYRSVPARRTSRVASVRSSHHSVRASEPTIINIPPPPPVAIPAPTGKVLPAPQPVPHFEAPRPPPPPPDVQYVHVSPRSSISDHHDDYVYERRERRYEREVEPQYYEYRHVSAPEEPRYRPRRERSRSRSRARSRSRVRYDDGYDDYDRTNVKVTRRHN